MKIKNLQIQNSQVNFADNINKIEYNQNLSVTEAQFEALKKFILNLTTEQHAELKIQHANIDEEKDSEVKATKLETLKNFIVDNGVSLANSISANAIFEAIKFLIA